jgi:hypothetical protein
LIQTAENPDRMRKFLAGWRKILESALTSAKNLPPRQILKVLLHQGSFSQKTNPL